MAPRLHSFFVQFIEYCNKWFLYLVGILRYFFFYPKAECFNESKITNVDLQKRIASDENYKIRNRVLMGIGKWFRDLVESGSLQIKRRFASAITFFSP